MRTLAMGRGTLYDIVSSKLVMKGPVSWNVTKPLLGKPVRLSHWILLGGSSMTLIARHDTVMPFDAKVHVLSLFSTSTIITDRNQGLHRGCCS